MLNYLLSKYLNFEKEFVCGLVTVFSGVHNICSRVGICFCFTFVYTIVCFV